mgnify:CR=1 FL=1
MTLETLGVHHVLTMDLHSDVIGGFFQRANVDYLYARPVFVSYFKEFFKDELKKDELIVVSPDAGGVVRAQSYAKRLMHRADLAIIHKERDIPNEVARMKLAGDVAGKVALIIDDMFDTCGTVGRAVDLLVQNGAKEVYGAATHGIFSGDALSLIEKSAIKRVFVTDTISYAAESPKVEYISVGEIFGDAIRRIENDQSLSALFEVDD